MRQDWCGEDQVSKRKKWMRQLDQFSREYEFLQLILSDENQDLKIDQDLSVSQLKFMVKLKRFIYSLIDLLTYSLSSLISSFYYLQDK